MRDIAIWLAAIAVSMGSAGVAFPQNVLITIKRPFQAQNLAGSVLDPAGAPVEGVLVEDCDATFTRILASTRTDREGRFTFSKAKSGSTHYLILSMNGFNPMHVTVRIRHLAHTGVLVHLYSAT